MQQRGGFARTGMALEYPCDSPAARKTGLRGCPRFRRILVPTQIGNCQQQIIIRRVARCQWRVIVMMTDVPQEDSFGLRVETGVL